MYGKNEVAGIDQRQDGALLVNAIFYTIQGEGPDAGSPAVFVRLAKCNLRCYFCDTVFDQGTRHDVDSLTDEIVVMCRKNNCQLVVITGGEPLLQNICPLVKNLNGFRIKVSVETAGTVWLEGVQELFSPYRDWRGNLIVVSPKTPKLSTKLLPYIGALKYIVRYGETHPRDGLPIMSTQLKGEPSLVFRPTPVLKCTIPIYLQPMDEMDAQANRDNAEHAAELCMRHGYKLSMQLHKMVGVP
jgi:organic radical activating enzyme